MCPDTAPCRVPHSGADRALQKKEDTMGARVHRFWAIVLPTAILGAVPFAHAVPSFARQTGMACEACHTVFPELTHFGRMFKANGYTLDNLKQVRDINTEKEDMLLLSSLAPLSAMVQISQTWLNQPLPDLAGNGTHS